VRAWDLIVAGLLGLRSRKLRAALSALGIAIGIAAGVAVLGISASSKANLLSQLGAEANLLTVSAGQSADGSPVPLPLTAEAMIGRIPPVESVTAIGDVPGVTVLRTNLIPAIDGGGISVLAAQPGLLATLGGSVAHGTFLNAATQRYPAVVLGAMAAQTLGIDRVRPDTQVYLGGRYFTVIGILRPVPLAPEIDEAALVGFPVANALLALGGHPTKLYLRRALGAARWHVGTQFLMESLLLSALGGVAGVLLGAAATVGYAIEAGQSAVLPPVAVAAGLGVAVGAGVLAGAYPAVKAARLAPAEALRGV
jgi:putative ABC transport system permease protein